MWLTRATLWTALAAACLGEVGAANEGDDYIKYWTDYQIVAKRCIVYKNVDQIVFQVYTGNDHCTSNPIGTYVTPVPYYVQGYLAQEQQKTQDMGQDDYVYPEAAEYVSCMPYETNSGYYWMQLGCADDTTQSLAVNIYSDNECTKRSIVDGYDDSTIDVSDVQVSVDLAFVGMINQQKGSCCLHHARMFVEHSFLLRSVKRA